MKSSQSNFNLRSPSSYLARSYLIATVINCFENFDFQNIYFLKICTIFVCSVDDLGRSGDNMI